MDGMEPFFFLLALLKYGNLSKDSGVNEENKCAFELCVMRQTEIVLLLLVKPKLWYLGIYSFWQEFLSVFAKGFYECRIYLGTLTWFRICLMAGGLCCILNEQGSRCACFIIDVREIETRLAILRSTSLRFCFVQSYD